MAAARAPCACDSSESRRGRAGSLLAVPAGLFQARAGGRVHNAAYLYARGRWAAPWLALPALKARARRRP